VSPAAEVTAQGPGPVPAPEAADGAGDAILRRVITYLPGSIVPAALTLVTSMVFTRIFDPAAYGTYSLVLVVANPVRLVFTTWLTQSSAKFLPPESSPDGRARLRAAVLVSTCGVVAVESVLGVVALAMAWITVPAGDRDLLLPALIFVLVSSMYEVLGFVFAVESRAREFTSYRLVDSVVTLALRLLLASAIVRMDIQLMFWSVVVSNGVLVPVMWWRGSIPGPAQLSRALRSAAVRRSVAAFLGFGLPMTVWFGASVLLDVGDRYVLGYLLGADAVGVYDASYRLIAGIAALLVVPVTITLHPHLMRIAGAGDTARTGALIGLTVENLLVVGALCVGVTVLLRADLADILLGPGFQEGSVVMAPVLAGVFLFNVGTFAHKPFEILGRTRPMVLFGVAAAVANVAFCFALIPPFGYVGAAWATLFAYLLYTVGTGLLGRRLIPWYLDIGRLARYGGGVAGGVLAISLLREALAGVPHVWGLIATVLSTCLLGAVVLLGLHRGRPASSVPREPAG